MVTINQMATMIMAIAGKKVAIKHVPGPQGLVVQLRQPRIRRKLGRVLSASLKDGARRKPTHGIAAEVYAPAGEQAEATSGAVRWRGTRGETRVLIDAICQMDYEIDLSLRSGHRRSPRPNRVAIALGNAPPHSRLALLLLGGEGL